MSVVVNPDIAGGGGSGGGGGGGGTLQYADLAAFPAVGDVNFTYIALDTSSPYIWNGSSYVAFGTSGMLPQATLGAGNTAITQADHLNRPCIVDQAGNTTGTFAATATSGAIAGASFFLRNTGAGTFTGAGAITAPFGMKLTAGPGEDFTADYDSVDDAFYSSTPIIGLLRPFRAKPTGWDYYIVPTLGTSAQSIVGIAGRTALGGSTLSSFGTNTSNTGNYFLRQVRWTETGTSAAVSLMAGSYYSQQQWPYANTAWEGFEILWTGGIGDTGNGSGQFYLGMTVTVPAFTNAVEPSAQTHHFGMGADTTDTNMQVMYNGAGTTTKVDLGVGFPANGGGARVNMYAFYLRVSSNGTTKSATWIAYNMTTGEWVTGTTTTNLPSDGSMCRVCCVRGSGNGAVTPILDMASILGGSFAART